VEWVKDGRGWIAEQCWFCTSSTQFESHLVTVVGDETYLTIAKGQLVPHHSLLVPVAHKASSLDLSAAEAAEVRSYVSAVRRCFAARGEALLTFERYLGGSSNRAQFEHMHLQLVPLPHDAANGAREAFEREGASRGVRFELLAAGTRLSDALPTPEPFFAVELPSGETLLHRLATNQRRHPLQFGREVIAKLIGKPERSDWKRCLPQEQPGGPPLGELERELASSFQEAFAPFAPTFA